MKISKIMISTESRLQLVHQPRAGHLADVRDRPIAPPPIGKKQPDPERLAAAQAKRARRAARGW